MADEHDDMRTKEGQSQELRSTNLLSLLRDFCGYTTVGGLGRVMTSRFLIFRLLWFGLFLAALTAGSIQLNSLFDKYRRKPINTRVFLENKHSLSFPSITICNFNMIRKSLIGDLPSSVKKDMQEFASIHSDGWLSRNHKSIKASSSANDSYGNIEEDDEGFTNPDDLEATYKETEKLSMSIASARPRELEPLGHQFDDFVLQCHYRGVNCRNYTSGKYWQQLWNYRFGNCYVFNPLIGINGKVLGGLSAYHAGPSQGLKLQLNVEQDEYIDQLTQEAGAVIYIAPRGKMAFPEEEGISVAPGYSTSIGMTKVEVKRVDRFNNGSCMSNNMVDTNDLYYKHYNASYSKTACVESCIAYTQKEYCGCMEYRFPSEDKVCDILNEKTVECLREITAKLKANKACAKKCPYPCTYVLHLSAMVLGSFLALLQLVRARFHPPEGRNPEMHCTNNFTESGNWCLIKEEVFKTSSSFAVWPSVNYRSFLKSDLEVENKYFSTPGGYRDNLLEMRIFYQKLNYEVIEEQVSYNVADFLSDIGGQLGLWLGISVLTGFEVLELAVYICFHLCQRKSKETTNDDKFAMESGNSTNMPFNK